MQSSSCEYGSGKLLQVVPAVIFPSIVSPELSQKKKPSSSPSSSFYSDISISVKEAELSSKTQVLLSRTKPHVSKTALSMAIYGGNEAKLWHAFNWSVRFHCDRIPLGFSCASLEAFRREYGDGRTDKEASDATNENNNEMASIETKKRVLILMSDTGGGHRASAEAIKATFELEYGDKYQVFLNVAFGFCFCSG